METFPIACVSLWGSRSKVVRALVEAATDLDKVGFGWDHAALSAARESGHGFVGYVNLVHALASGTRRSSIVT